MKRSCRLGGLLLALSLVFSLCVTPAGAAGPSMSNFKKQRTYYSSVFSDVKTSQWSYSVIKTCYEYGLMQGSGGKFNSNGTLTVAEALVMADRVHQIYNTGANTLTNGSPWYQPYVNYALSNGIISSGDFSSYTAKISRADMAYVFSHALPASQLGEIKTVNNIPDVNAAPYRDRSAIWMLYRAGVLTGSDSYGTFKPNSYITRQEAAAIIARIAIRSESRSDPLLQKVTDNVVTFGLPQTGAVKKTTSSTGARMYSVEGGTRFVMNISTKSNSAFSGISLPSVLTAAQEKSIMEDRSNGSYLTNCVVTKVSFGGIQAYRSEGNFTSDSYSYSYPSLTYRFISGTTLYGVTLIWLNGSVDKTLLSKVANSIAVNGNAASPAYVP